VGQLVCLESICIQCQYFLLHDIFCGFNMGLCDRFLGLVNGTYYYVVKTRLCRLSGNHSIYLLLISYSDLIFNCYHSTLQYTLRCMARV
jgi:hypothetical protein